jgi:hypothetical protein
MTSAARLVSFIAKIVIPSTVKSEVSNVTRPLPGLRRLGWLFSTIVTSTGNSAESLSDIESVLIL